MNKIFRTIAFGLALLASLALPVAQANQILINPYVFAAGGGGGSNVSISFVACTGTTTDGTATTFAAHDVGTASATRKTLVGVSYQTLAAQGWTTSVTVGGDAAEMIATTGVQTSVSAVDFWIVDNAVGTSEDIVVTTSQSSAAKAICVWELNDSTYSFPTSTNLDFSATAATLSLDNRADSVSVAMVSSSTVAATETWVGLTERADSSNVDMNWSAADATTVGAADNTTITATPSAGLARGISMTFSNDHTTPVIYLTSCPRTSVGATTYQWTNASVGIPDAGRVTIALVASEDAATNFNFSSASIGGSAMATTGTETSTVGLVEAQGFYFLNTAGFQEDFSVTMSEATTNYISCLWAAYGLGTNTPNAGTANATNGGASIAGSVNTDTNGVVAMLCMEDTVDSATIVGIDRKNSNFSLSGTDAFMGDEDQVAAATPRTMTCDPDTATTDAAVVGVSFD